ncbi:hypothetical protein [Halalkalibacter oceani]|uniref:Uncharacterized protein n=1 Tax=Halalkalibacter oceani TaxID=1653776 RepID=A0A9X2DS69_9BACI|nr:hypothetical protein [Halalkalibacter oceani]MCM3715185.1 hypothetical protein [Halalkalibacter oceani]
MDLFGLLTFIGVFCVFDAIRRLNNNVLNQTEEIRKLREDLRQGNKN